jgi:heme A synthase
MGGATVLTRITPLYSTIHLGLSHLFFGTLLFIYFPTCDEAKWPVAIPKKLIKLSGIATALVFIQIMIGAYIRHYGAGPACGLGWENSLLCHELTSEAHALWPHNGPGQLHMLHRIFGALVMFALIGLTVPTLKFARLNKLKSLRRHLIGIHLVVTVQVLLGIMVVGTNIHPHVITLHLALALTLWALTLGLFIKLKGTTGR